jgi:Flp pilus assembly protein TadG
LGPRTSGIAQKLKERAEDESGAELVEFAFVVVLLIALLYGIISYGLILGAQATLNQAAADGARAGIVVPSTTTAALCATTTSPATPCSTADGEAGNDVGWMDKGTCATSATIITCVTTEAPCPSNANVECLTTVVKYNYAASPLFPELPGMDVITPSTLTATNTLQISNPSS